MPADIIAERKKRTNAVLGAVRDIFVREVGDSWDTVIGDHTTIYVTGSAGRGDMGPASDLDPYVVREGGDASEVHGLAIETALENALARTGLPPLDANGDHARLVSGQTLFDHLGSPKDDESGALTKRMLLLLESQPLVNPEAYQRLLAAAVDAYWKNEELHPNDYLPIVLVNDIVRYWRIVLLNHESRLRAKSQKDKLSDAETRALRRYSSYKLRVARCLSCFSALSYLLALTPTEPAHISREDVHRMVGMTPLERLLDLREYPDTPVETVDALRDLYLRFLERTEKGKTALTDALMRDESEVARVSAEGREFPRHMFDLVQQLGGGRTLHRAIVV